MKLYLARHGMAVPHNVDPDCPLSGHGEEEIKKLASYLGQSGVQVSRVAHSGKTRARQTAQILAGSIAPGAAVTAIKGLKPMDSVEPVAKMAGGFKEDTLLVGHLPFMEKLLSLLVAGDEEAGVAQFTTGAVACLKRDDNGNFSMIWMTNPESMRLL
ncbi:hypothetical protein MNBD_NITROSPINAE03-829 [hydrothermal vent metagenome]|uniref:Phosphohistidine phosphatase SixA n=1 Tax=hydrothermal vent metagenome TaxID=652676 RepID=A0A3B1C3Z4_9ZZZZ